MAAHPAFELDWNLLRTFVAVVRAGSLSAATEALGLAHPTVARHVQQLEQALDMQLFDRTSKGSVVNDAGRQIAEAVETMRVSALAVQSTAEAFRQGIGDTVRITVADVLAEPMPEFLPAPSADGTGPNLEVLVANQQLNLLERDADIAIRHVRPEQRDLVARNLGTVAFAAFASRSYLEQFGELTADGIARHRFIDGTLGRLEHELRLRGFDFKPNQVCFRSDSMSSQVRACEAGWGIAAMPFHMAVARPELELAFQAGHPALIDVWLLGRPEVRFNKALGDTFDLLTDTVGQFLRRQAALFEAAQERGSLANARQA